MSVLSIRDRLTQSEIDFDSARKSARSLVYVSPAPPQPGHPQPGPVRCDDLEIELTVGTRWGNFLESDQPKLVDISEAPIRVGPYDSVVIEVEQKLALPNNVFGIVFPKSSLVQRSGLAPLTTKIDPTYKGKLLILVWNLGPVTKTLEPGEALVSVTFVSTDETLDIPRPDQRALESGGSRAAIAMQRKIFLNSAVVAGIVSGLVAALVAALITFVF